MSSETVYLISGANRGIGYKLASIIAARPDTIVFAGARDPTAQSLTDLSAKYPNVHAVKLTSGDEADNAAAIAEIQRIAGHLDVIIANAGIAKYYGPLATTPVSELRDHWEVNTLGLVILFQAAHRLLLASPTNTPIFAFISSIAGSMGQHLPIQSSPYGSSKAAANFLIKSMHSENPMLIAMAIHPGFVMTEMGMDCATAIGIPKPPHDMDEAVAGVMSRIDGATREASGGRFWNFKVTRGNPWDVETEEVPW